MISGRNRMISDTSAPIGTNSGGRKSRCSQSWARMISSFYTYPLSANLGTQTINDSLQARASDGGFPFEIKK